MSKKNNEVSQKVVDMDEAKKLVRKNRGNPVPGVRFEAPTGVHGVIMKELSDLGKVQAVMNCIEDGCPETHVREISDWHQSTRCRDHAHEHRQAKLRKLGNRMMRGELGRPSDKMSQPRPDMLARVAKSEEGDGAEST